MVFVEAGRWMGEEVGGSSGMGFEVIIGCRVEGES